MDPGNTIQIHFAALDLETHSDCGWDRLGKLSIINAFQMNFSIFHTVVNAFLIGRQRT